MSKRIKKRIFAGAVCDQLVYSVGDGTKNLKTAEPRLRFKNDEERAEHCRLIARRYHARVINENYSTSSLYSTLTLNDEHEVHTFNEARKIRDRYYNRLKYAFPAAKIHIYMGRGKSTHRIHLHMLSDGIPEEDIKRLWTEGEIVRISALREHNYYEGVDCGQDYTGLANYLFDHWTPEQGGRCRYKYSRKTIKTPEPEKPTECKRKYSTQNPPAAPKGYRYIRCEYNKYGYMCFHYVRIQEKRRKRAGAANGTPPRERHI